MVLESAPFLQQSGEQVQPLSVATESTAIAITTAVLQVPEVEPLQWIRPEEGVLPRIKVFYSKTTIQSNLQSSRNKFVIQNTSNNHEQTQHVNNSSGNNSINTSCKKNLHQIGSNISSYQQQPDPDSASDIWVTQAAPPWWTVVATKERIWQQCMLYAYCFCKKT
jgi:hypothetical protein